MAQRLMQWAVAAVVILSVVAGLQAAEDKSLVLQLSFSEGTGAVVNDSSGNGNNGAIKGAQWTPLAKGFALKFNGTDNLVEIPSSPTLCMNDSDFTIAMWIKPNDLSKAQVLVSKGICQEFMIAEGKDYGPRTCMFLTDWEMYRYSTNILKAGEWVHVAYVKSKTANGAELTCYANGQVSGGGNGAQAFPVMIKPTTYSMLIGGVSDRWFYDGLIREVKMYKRALSGDEILAEFNKVSKADLEVKPAT